MRPPPNLPPMPGGFDCHAMRRFSSNSMIVLSIEYGIPSFMLIPNFEPSASRCDGSFDATTEPEPSMS